MTPNTTTGDLPDEAVERYCELMHYTYEGAARGAGWETNPASRVSWPDVPEANKAAMRISVTAVAAAVRAETAEQIAAAIEVHFDSDSGFSDDEVRTAVDAAARVARSFASGLRSEA